MDQKNTIVKCKAYPNCLFNHNGVCDNYVITIGVDGKCQEYIETEDERVLMCEHCDYYSDNGLLQNPCNKRECYMHRKENACTDFKIKKGLRAKGVFIEDAYDDKVAITMKIAEFDKSNKNKSTIRDVVPECDLPVCDWSCRHALRSGPSFNPELWCDIMKQKPAVGLFCSDYEEEK